MACCFNKDSYSQNGCLLQIKDANGVIKVEIDLSTVTITDQANGSIQLLDSNGNSITLTSEDQTQLTLNRAILEDLRADCTDSNQESKNNTYDIAQIDTGSGTLSGCSSWSFNWAGNGAGSFDITNPRNGRTNTFSFPNVPTPQNSVDWSRLTLDDLEFDATNATNLWLNVQDCTIPVSAGLPASPNLMPTSSLSSPFVTAASTPTTVDLIWTISNIAATNSSGLITVRIAKSTQITFTWDGGAATIGGSAVDNSSWTFDNTDALYYIWTTSDVIAGSSDLKFGYVGNVPVSVGGEVYPSDLEIVCGSGGEFDCSDNTNTANILVSG